MRQIVLIIAQLVFAASLGLSFVNAPAMTAQTTGKVTSFETDTNNPFVLQEGMPTTNMDEHARDGWLNVMDMGATGSVFETTATATKGSNQIIVSNIGDFQVGQQISISRCNIRYLQTTLWGPGEPYSTARPANDAVEIRGYNGIGGSWLAYIIEIDNAEPLSFRWKGDIGKDWFGEKVPVTFEWQMLSGGSEIRFKRQEWVPGNMISFSARDQLETTITKIDGNVLTLSDSSNNTSAEAIVRHVDREAIQKAIDYALKENLNLFFPIGHYRIPGGLQVLNAKSIRIEGANAFTTILDISDGSGSCLSLQGGTEVTVRNFTMIGHTGLAEAPKSFTMVTGYGYFPNSLKGCNAIGMSGTERVLIENVHVSRMSNEAFYEQGPERQGNKEPAQYQKSLTYLRCTVTDCAANAFNNNDRAENTSILYCRVDGAGWHAAEMPSRFLRVIGSYFRNTGAITVGDMSHRFEDLNELGCGQAFICNNVFEGIGRSGGIAVNYGSSQVVISGNVFVNFNGPAITVSSATVRPTLPWYKPDAPLDWGSYPSRSVIITDNIIDMTCTDQNPVSRIGINISASEVTIADNQIYVRGKADPLVTGIQLLDPALKVNVHDNLISNCGGGIITGRASSRITQVNNKNTFHESSLPLEWRYSHQYQDWELLWISEGKVTGSSVIDLYDPLTLVFKLKDPYDMKKGDVFEVHSPGPANWNIHNNTITGCLKPVVLDNYGSETNRFHFNIIERGNATGVKAAVTVGGWYQLTENQIIGFDEPCSIGLLLMPDRMGKPLPNTYRDNLILRCNIGASESVPGLWKASLREGNSFADCPTGMKK